MDSALHKSVSADWAPVLLRMWTPGLVAIALSFYFRENGLWNLIRKRPALKWRGGVAPLLIGVLIYAPTIRMIFPVGSCLGEEIGWRGFLTPAMSFMKKGPRFLAIGLIWAVWHWPLILFSDYATSERPWVSVALFTVGISASSVYITWIQERSRSLWTSVLCHAVHNMWILGILPVFYRANSRTAFWMGESGIFAVAAYVLLVGWITRDIWSPDL